MCVYSAVMDSFKPWIPKPDPWPPSPPGGSSRCPKCGVEHYGFHFCLGRPPWSPPMSPDDVRKILDAFEGARKAAATVDEVTGQKDCADPEKAKLLDRVAELEKRLEAIEKAKPAKKSKRRRAATK